MATTTYLINGTGGAGYMVYNGAYGPPAVWGKPSTAITAAEENTISADDANFVRRNGCGGSYIEFRGIVNIAEAVGTISQIDVTVKAAPGLSFSFDTMTQHSANFSTSAWVSQNVVVLPASYTKATYTYSLTGGDITDAISGTGDLEVLQSWIHNHGGTASILDIYYVEVVVTYEEVVPSLILENVICENVILE